MTTRSVKDASKPASVKAASDRDAMLADLKKSGLTAADAKNLHLRPFTEAESTGLGLSRARAGYQIPYFDLHGAKLPMYRYRYFESTVTSGFLKGTKLRKYDQPRDTSPELYLPHCESVDWDAISRDENKAIVITEGEKKAACATKNGIPAVGLGGVYSFGSKVKHQPLIPMLEKFKWHGREVYVVFDSDAATNLNILKAENRLARILLDKIAQVHIVRLPSEGNEKIGLDDFIVKHGADKFRELLRDSPSYGPTAALHALNEDVVFVEHPCMVLRYPKESHPTDQPLIRMLTLAEFTKGVFADRLHFDNGSQKPKQVSTAQAWLKWPGRAKVDSLTYAPGEQQIVGGQFNLWGGWGVEPKKGNVEPFLEFYNHLTEGLNEGHRRWLLQWFAYPLQHPGAKLHTAVVFWTPAQGVGKSLLGNTFKRIYGSSFSKVTKRELIGQFNEWQQYKCFVMGEEITGSDARDASKFADVLKDYITAESVQVNQKFRDLANIPNTINYYFTSNHQDAFQIERDDRRYFVHEVTSKKWTTQQFDAYLDWLEKGGAAALFDYMLHEVSLDGFNAKAAAPQTAAREAMGDAGAPPAVRVVRDFLRNPDLFGNAYKDRDLWTAKDIVDVYHALNHMDPDARYIKIRTVGRALKNEGLRTNSTSVPLVSGNGNAKWPTVYVLSHQEKYVDKTDQQLVAAYGAERKSGFMRPKRKVTTKG